MEDDTKNANELLNLKQEFYCEMSGKTDVEHKGDSFHCKTQCWECILMVNNW